MTFLMVKKKLKSYSRFREKSIILNLTYWLKLTFSQWYLVTRGVGIHFKMPEIM